CAAPATQPRTPRASRRSPRSLTTSRAGRSSRSSSAGSPRVSEPLGLLSPDPEILDGADDLRVEAPQRGGVAVQRRVEEVERRVLHDVVRAAPRQMPRLAGLVEAAEERQQIARPLAGVGEREVPGVGELGEADDPPGAERAWLVPPRSGVVPEPGVSCPTKTRRGAALSAWRVAPGTR